MDTPGSMVPASPVPAPVPPLTIDLSQLAFWHRRYLGARQAGLTTTEALSRANVSAATISDWTNPSGRHYHPAFARACAMVEDGLAVMGVPAGREQAGTYLVAAVDDAWEASQTAEHERDRVANRRWIGEVAGVGPPSQAAGGHTDIRALILQISQEPGARVPPPLLEVEKPTPDKERG